MNGLFVLIAMLAVGRACQFTMNWISDQIQLRRAHQIDLLREQRHGLALRVDDRSDLAKELLAAYDEAEECTRHD